MGPPLPDLYILLTNVCRRWLNFIPTRWQGKQLKSYLDSQGEKFQSRLAGFMILGHGEADHHGGREWRRKADHFLATRSKDASQEETRAKINFLKDPVSSNWASYPKYFL